MTVYSLLLADFLLTTEVWWCSFSAKWSLKSCTLTLLNASSIKSIPFGVYISAWFHAWVRALSYLVLSFFSKIRVALKMSTAVLWWMSSFALIIDSTPENAVLPYMQTELPWAHLAAGNCISSAMLKRWWWTVGCILSLYFFLVAESDATDFQPMRRLYTQRAESALWPFLPPHFLTMFCWQWKLQRNLPAKRDNVFHSW